MAHLQCEGCSTYVPRNYPANIRCTVCRLVYCGEYTGKMNCEGVSLHSIDTLAYKNNSAREVAMDSFPEYVRLNREEIDRFEAYLASNNITVPMILQLILRKKEETYEPPEDEQFMMESQGVARGNPWNNAVVCTTCIETLVRVQSCVWEWWIEERKRGCLDRTLSSYALASILTSVQPLFHRFPIVGEFVRCHSSLSLTLRSIGMDGSAGRRPKRSHCLRMPPNTTYVLMSVQTLYSH